MKKFVAIGGIPATGKTTLVKNILTLLNPKNMISFGLVRGYLSADKKTSILGLYKPNETFAGTDKLSMAVQKDYDKFIEQKKYNILFEGDRLFTKNNLLYAVKNFETKIIILESDKDTIHKRHIERDDNQSDKFIKSRITKIANIIKEPNLTSSITFHTLDTHTQSRELALEIKNFLI